MADSFVDLNMENDEENRDLLDLVEEVDDEEVSPEKPFDPNKVNIVMKQLTINSLMKLIMAQPPEINLFTPFSRKIGLWNDEQKSRLIESLLLRIPLPAFYFDGTDYDNWLVVDGLQRLSVFKEFIGIQSFWLKGLEYFVEFNGRTFNDLPRNIQRRIEETPVVAYIIQPGTPEEVKFNIFIRINTGGTPLSSQEIRHFLNQGFPAEFLNDLADLPEFIEVIGDIQKERMEDREIILRFLAFHLSGFESYQPSMDWFLNIAMKNLNQLSESKRNELRNLFRVAMQRVLRMFEDKAFRKPFKTSEGNIIYLRFSKALFDVWSVVLAGLNDEEFELLFQRRETVEEEFITLFNNDFKFKNAIIAGIGGGFQVKTRFQRIYELVRKVLENDQQN